MEDISKLSPTELLVLINKVKEKHDLLRQEIINHSYEVEQLEKTINNKINELTELEKYYVSLIDEMEKR